jgi:hypothetical protein
MRSLTKSQLIRRITMLGTVVACIAIGGFEGACAATVSGELSCPQGLLVHLYTPRSAEAKLLRLSNGVQLRVSDPLLTITPPMVSEARILMMRVDAAPADRARYRIPEATFGVTLRLSTEGRDRIRKSVSRDSIQLVVVCNGVVMVGFSIGTPPDAIGINIDGGAQAAEQFAHSFTQNVHSTYRTPPPSGGP